MEWTVAKIKAKVRKITGRPDIGQLSEADLLGYINNYYQYVLPEEVGLVELDTWFELETEANEGEYALDPDMQKITNPFTVDGQEKNLYFDPVFFFRKWPRHLEATAETAEPENGLIYDRILYLRPIPDDIYTVKTAVGKRPSAFAEDTDKPEDNKWGPLIAHGAGIDILTDAGEDAEAQVKRVAYNFYRVNVTRKQIYSLLHMRSKPRP